MNSKRGGLIAEAAVVFPVVLIVVMTVIYILIALYMEASYSSRDHLALRYESGMRTETVERADDYGELAPEDKFGKRPFNEDAGITDGSKFPDNLLFADRGRVYVIDESGYIRKIDLIKVVHGEM